MSENVIRVAHIIGKLNAAGVESVVNNYYRNIDHDKFQFDYYIDSDSTCAPPQELIDMGARYYVIPPYQKLPQHIKALEKAFCENHYQIVHSSMNTLAVFSLFAAWRAGVPVRINHNHSTAAKGESKKNVLKYILRPFSKMFATNYCACSRYAGEWLFGKCSMEKGDVTIFNNAIDLEKFKYDPQKRQEVRTALGIKGKFVVGHVGRFCYQKNHDFLIDVFDEVHKRDHDSVLLLVGIGELTDEVKKKVHVKGLDDTVIFLGARNDVNELYQAMDVFVLPSRYEGLPVVGIEAQAAGVPCLLSTEVTKDAKILETTIMIPLSELPAIWSDKIISFNDFTRKDTSIAIKEAGFDIAVEAKKLEKYYDSLIHPA